MIRLFLDNVRRLYSEWKRRRHDKHEEHIIDSFIDGGMEGWRLW